MIEASKPDTGRAEEGQMARMRWGIAIPALLVLEACTARQPAAPPAAATKPAAPAATNKAAQAAAGGTAELCLTLTNGHKRAAGAQVDIAWDASCMEPLLRKSSAPDCTANPATGKDVNAHVNGASMRALFFSMSDSSPIPDGRLFCCRFRMIASTRSCCSLAPAN